MILVGIDDTDTLDSPGTNHVARGLVAELPPFVRCRRIVRHQLLFDPRVPYTSKNSSASLWIESGDPHAAALSPIQLAELIDQLRRSLRDRFQPGSDPGLCVLAIPANVTSNSPREYRGTNVSPPSASCVPIDVIDFAKRCQRDVVTQSAARRLANRFAVHLEGLGGTEDGVIGALAAVGLAATGDDGRVVQIDERPDDLSGFVSAEAITSNGVDEIRCRDDGRRIDGGTVDVGKHLRPNLRGGRIVLLVERSSSGGWVAVRET